MMFTPRRERNRMEKWFKPGKHTGWKKSLPSSTRRYRLLASTDKRMTMRKRYVQAGRKAMALANVTEDTTTERKARADAKYFFQKVR